mgnify:FL=1
MNYGGPNPEHFPSARVELRNNLLNNDFGDIDISQEKPINMPELNNQENKWSNEQQQQQENYQQGQVPQQNQQYYTSPQHNQQYYTSPQQQYPQLAQHGFVSPQDQNQNQQYPTQQQPQQQSYTSPRQQRQQPMQQQQQQHGFVSPQQQRFTSPQQQQMSPSPQQQKPYQRMQNYRNNQNAHNSAQKQKEQDKRTYSLNQKSFSNFFKGKSHQMGFNMGKRAQKGNTSHFGIHRNTGGAGGDDDDEGGDILLDEPESALMTFDDITTITYKKGDKLGMGDTTAPIIPTIITKEGKNMNNTEYRKYITNQKKTAYTAMAKQNQMVQNSPTNNGNMPMGPRAMSLQTNQNSYLQQQQQQQQRMPQQPNGQQGFQYQNMNGSNPNIRANSLAQGPGPNFAQRQGFAQNQQQQQQQNQFGVNNSNNGQFQRQNGVPQQQMQGFNQNNEPPRAMSLATGSNPNFGSQQNFQRFNNQGMANNNNQGMANNNNQNVEQNSGYINQNNVQGEQQQQQQQPDLEDQYRTMSLQTNPMSRGNLQQFPDNSGNNINNPNVSNVRNGPMYSNSSSSATPTPVGSEISYHGNGSVATTNNDEHVTHQKTFDVTPTRDSPQSNFQGPAQHVEQSDNQPKTKLNVLKLSEPQQQELRDRNSVANAQPNTTVLNNSNIAHQGQQKSMRPQSDDLGLRPTSLLESGLKSLIISDDKTISENRESTQTYMSAFSDSSMKMGVVNPNNAAMYGLENGSNTPEFLTAQDLTRSDTDVGSKKPEVSSTSLEKIVSSGTVTETINSTLKVIPSNESGSNDKRVSNMSTSTGVKLDLDTETGDVDDTFDYKQQNPHVPVSTGDSQSTIPKRVQDVKQQTDIPNSNIDDFLFDNTLNESYTDLADREIKSIHITGEQLSLLNQNKSLMREMTLLSSELGESIKRETTLSEQLNKMASSNPFNASKEEGSISLSDFENELRKKSSKILELIQSLNDERLKRFIAEEQILLSEVNARPSTIELIADITELKNTIQSKDDELEALKLKMNESA